MTIHETRTDQQWIGYQVGVRIQDQCQCDLSQWYNSADIFMFISTHIAGKTSKYEDIRQAIEESEKTEFDKAIADFSPWLSDTATQNMVDPNSIDIGFSFPGQHSGLHSRCILIQVLFSEALLTPNCRIIGITATGHNHQSEQWHFSTIGDWEFEGVNQPISFCQEKLRRFARQVLVLFKHPINLNC